MLKKIKLSVSTVQVMPLFPFLIWFSNSLPFAFSLLLSSEIQTRSEIELSLSSLFRIFPWFSYEFLIILLLTPPRRRGQTTSLRSSTSLDIHHCWVRHVSMFRARPSAAGPSCHAAWKKAWHLWHLGENRYLQEHPVWVTWGGCILNSPPNMAWTMYNDHITITISKYDSDFGCYAPQLGTLPKMPLFACQVQKSKGKCKMSHHWVII